LSQTTETFTNQTSLEATNRAFLSVGQMLASGTGWKNTKNSPILKLLHQEKLKF